MKTDYTDIIFELILGLLVILFGLASFLIIILGCVFLATILGFNGLLWWFFVVFLVIIIVGIVTCI